MASDKPLRYIDACVLLSYIEDEPQRADLIDLILQDAVDGKFRLCTSVITIVEVVYAAEEKRSKKLSQSVIRKIAKLWEPMSSPIRLVEVGEIIAKEALALHRKNIPTGTTGFTPNDGIHIITAKREKVTEFFTYDKHFNRFNNKYGFKICHPYRDATEATQSNEGNLFIEGLSNATKPDNKTGSPETTLPARPSPRASIGRSNEGQVSDGGTSGAGPSQEAKPKEEA